MDRDNDFTPYVSECTIDTDAVTACSGNFTGKTDQETHVITDNAPVHKSDRFLSCLPEREEKGLHAVFPSAYSPELNLTEIPRQKIKYGRLPSAACVSFQAPAECAEDIPSNFGPQYTIESE